MKDCIKIGKKGTQYFLSGREVTQAEYEDLYPPLEGEGFPVLRGWTRPMASDAMAVHPDQIPEAMERDRKHGLAIEYLPDGRPLLHSEEQKKAKAKSHSLHDRNCYNW